VTGDRKTTPLADYAVIGDSRSAALVSNRGSVDWLCWPRFDSGSLFAAIVDAAAGGHFQIAPAGSFDAARRYLDRSNVLVTDFETRDGTLRVTDLMTVFGEDDKRHVLVPEHELLRLVECVRGEVDVEVTFQPRVDYARRAPALRFTPALGVRVEDGRHLYTLRADVPLQPRADAAVGRFPLRAGERRQFSLSYDSGGPAVLPPLGARADEAVLRTTRWWRQWVGRCSYDGPYREQVERSLLILKLLSFAPSGAIVAAPTTSLPERLGGDLNWDYRYCWARDAALTMRALLDLGYEDEAVAFAGWLLHATRLTRPRLSILYDVYGGLPDAEAELAHLAGHSDSRPVRIGNAAAGQLQLDVYGEVVDAVAQLCRRGATLDRETSTMLRQFGEYVCKNWQRADHGIWEPRSTPQHHTHSRVLCWAALDRLLELQRRGVLGRIPARELEHSRGLIRRDVEAHGWNPALSSYTQVLGGDTLDAGLLLLGWYGFAEPRSPRMQATFARIRERLEVAPGLFYRYEESRGAGEGAFAICSAWACEFLARGGGTLEDAERAFERLVGCANDVGILAEEIDPQSGAPLGNLPQAFSHVGVIGAALAIEERRRGEGRSAGLLRTAAVPSTEVLA
jgi:GH15 family glucan-1,4-alpha-glucosidase